MSWLMPVLQIAAMGFLAWVGGGSAGTGTSTSGEPQKQGLPMWVYLLGGGVILIVILAIIFRKK